MLTMKAPGSSSYKVHPALVLLNQRAHVPANKGFSIRSWIHSALKLYEQGSVARIENRPKDAYVAYMKLCTVAVEVVPKHSDFSIVQKDPTYLDLRKKVTEIMPVLESLAKEIEANSESSCTSGREEAKSEAPVSADEPPPTGLNDIPSGNTSARIQQFLQMAKANGSLASKPVSLAGRPINGVLSQPEPTVSRPPPPSESVDPRSQVAHLSPAAAPNNTRCSSPPTETTTVPSSAPSTVGTVNSLSSSLSPSSSMYLKPGEKGLYAEILRARAQSAATSRNNSISSVRSDMSRSGDRDSGKDIPQQLPSPQPRPAVPTSSTAGEEHRARRKALPPLPHANRSTVSETAASPPAEFSTDEFRQDFPLAPSPPPELDLASFQRSATNNTSATTKTAASTEFRHPVPLSASDVSFPLSTTVTAEALHRYLAHSPAAERPTVLLLDVRPKSLCDAARIAHAYRIHLDPEWVVDANVTTADLERHLRQRPTGDGGAASDWFGQRDRFDLLVMYDADGAGVPQRTLPSSLIPVPSTSGGSPLTETAETTQVTPLQRLFTVIYERAFTCMPQRMPVFLEGGFAAWKRFARAHPRLLPTLIEPPSALSLPAQPSSTASIATAVPSTTTTTSPTNRPAPEVQPSGQPINRDIYDFLKRSGSRTQPAAAKPSARPVDGPGKAASSQRPPIPFPGDHPPSPVYSSDLPSVVLSRMYGRTAALSTPPPTAAPTTTSAGATTASSGLAKGSPTAASPVKDHSSRLHRRRSVFDNPYYGFTHTPDTPVKTRPAVPPPNYPPIPTAPVVSIAPAIPARPVAPPVPAPASSPLGSSPANPAATTKVPSPVAPIAARNQVSVPQAPLPPRPAASQQAKAVADPGLRPPVPATMPMGKSSSVPGPGHPAHPYPRHMLPGESASPTATTTSQSSSPAIPQIAHSGQLVHIGTTGLRNFGNTCFMNTIVQCLSGTSPLARYFMDGSYRAHLNRTNTLGTHGVLAESFAVLVRTMWSGQYSVISPVGFREAIARFAPQFKGDDQQDSQELLVFLLDGLHEDLNLARLDPNDGAAKVPSPPHITDTISDEAWEALPVRRASDLAWEKYLMRNTSVIVGLFQGQLQSKLRCLSCGRTSTTYTPFMTLSIPIPVDHHHPSSPSSVSLYQCLDHFVKEEVLDGEDQWHCPRCKTRRRTSKRLSIARLPDVLLIHLKRFSFQGPFRDKLDTPVDFPVRNLDMGRYVAAPFRTALQSSPASSGASPSSEGSAAVAPPSLAYDLYGVSNHFGGLSGGHYTAMVRSGLREKWFYFDDSRVLESDESKAVTKAAYNLFYVRNNLT